MREGFPLLTSKKMAWKSMVIELLWFLKGDTNIKYLVDNGCYIWVGDAYKNYMNNWPNELPRIGPCTREEFIEKIKTDNEFAAKWGELGPIYGKQWRNWTYFTREKKEDIEGIDEYSCGIDIWDGYAYLRTLDQMQKLISDLKTNPDSRRLMVNAWNVGEIDEMVLPPCHYGFQCYTRELTHQERHQLSRQFGLAPKWSFVLDENGNPAPNTITEEEHLDKYNVPKRTLSLKWTQRSVDTFLGLPFNIASYGLLLHLLAKEVNMIPEDLIFSGGDVHIYLNHIESCNTQLKQKTYKLPSIEIADKSIFDIDYSDIKLVNYESSPASDFYVSSS
jgi:thymidylate synthase